jgi:hypothetical protein
VLWKKSRNVFQLYPSLVELLIIAELLLSNRSGRRGMRRIEQCNNGKTTWRWEGVGFRVIDIPSFFTKHQKSQH